jgi:hypothetical protein
MAYKKRWWFPVSGKKRSILDRILYYTSIIKKVHKGFFKIISFSSKTCSLIIIKKRCCQWNNWCSFEELGRCNGYSWKSLASWCHHRNSCWESCAKFHRESKIRKRDGWCSKYQTFARKIESNTSYLNWKIR